MSRRGPSIDFNPLLEQVQRDISFLSYLGLHQYAKGQKLIGRSRPMITKDMDFVKQRRLNFRLLVACIQQIVGRTHFDHNGRVEQINYVNVGNYAQLRLYGLLDRDMYALDTTTDSTLTGWWPSQLSYNDTELLGSTASMDTIEEQLSYNARATLEVGGHTFVDHMRRAFRFIPDDLTHMAPHSQRDPRNRMRVKNLSLNLQLIESRSYNTGSAHIQTLNPGRDVLRGTTPGFVDVPCHIERLLHFRDVLWPWIQALSTPEAREAFGYVKENYPGVQAVQVKTREIRNSVMEIQRREREADDERAQRETDQAQLRDRLVATYGEPVAQEINDEQVAEDDVQTAETGDPPRGYHGGELAVPYGRIPPPEPVEAEFIEEDAEQTPPDAPDFGFIEQDGVVVLPVPDVHHGTVVTEGNQVEPPITDIVDLRARLREYLETEGEEDGN